MRNPLAAQSSAISRRWHVRARTCAALAAIALAACATPAERFDRRADTLGFEGFALDGEGFTHRAYAAGIGGADTLHVYVEHDGTPWIGETLVSGDPTPRKPFVLELMAKDPSPRLFLGRPCYFVPAADARCNPLLWTHERYSVDVVRSMVAALRVFLATHPFRNVVLIGYSGGGTIAWLMAARMPEVSSVVTIAANLDIDAWVNVHGYSPLAGSLNPAREPPLTSVVGEVHFYGGRDANVTPSVVLSFARTHSGARVIEIAEFDHECCWIERWPQLLQSPR